MTNPRLLCMDEPSMGLAPRLVEDVFEIIRTINDQGTTIFVIEDIRGARRVGGRVC